jgi:hypothetical protein
MRRLSRLQKSLVIVGALVSFLGVATSVLVLYAGHAIQRGARWQGATLRRDGLALVFLCEPTSGIRHAYFFVAPWARVKLEKINAWERP